MARPIKPRRIEFVPTNTYFYPVGKRKCEIIEMDLKLEELEAMRLKDIEKLSQEDCAKRMNVSRQTFQNIIDQARMKVAQALINGNAIKIEGGNYTLNICKYVCNTCGFEFEKKYENKNLLCPNCESNEIICIKKSNFCKKNCQKNI
ncbi:DUF134 domain-containing protein [Peptostreptococcaceae bacterium AGR-M142]